MELTVYNTLPEDSRTLALLWEEVFSDPVSLIGSFFSSMRNSCAVIAAHEDDNILCAGYLIEAKLINCGAENKCRILYALSTHPQHRGKGLASQIIDASKALCAEENSVLILRPAEESLFDFYAARGFQSAFTFQTITGLASTGSMVRPVDFAGYERLRENMLSSLPHLHFSHGYMAFNEEVCSSYGGGLFAVKGGCACAEKSGGTAVIKELLVTGDPYEAAAAVASQMGAANFSARIPDKHGRPFAMSASDTFTGAWFGPALD